VKLPLAPPARLPPLQQRWMDELLKAPIPGEPRSTCSTCPQIAAEQEERGLRRFDERTKCCTYMPAIYNFLAGRVLDEPDAGAVPGRDTLEARIDKGEAVTPLGLLATQEYVAAYSADEKFGHDYELRCPHYLREQNGACGVWKHREGTCSTWFCKHVRGAVAFDFWRRGMTPLLRAAERALAAWCAEQLGASEQNWGPFEGKPRELYRQSARLVENLPWSDVVQIGGEEVHKLAEDTRGYFAQLAGDVELPSKPHVAPYEIHEDDGKVATLITYTPFDPLEIPSALLRELHRFDGRPRGEVVRELKSAGVALPTELMRQLADWRVLVDEGEDAPVPSD
jgi:hypothetical protein